MSQVKNLRAMFENKGDTNPPDRGRSLGDSTSSSPIPAGPNGTDSPRPLSKVRTNFVAIEKDGRIGLRRDNSGGSSLSRRRMSIENDAASPPSFPNAPASASSGEKAKTVRKADAGSAASNPNTVAEAQIDEELPPSPTVSKGAKAGTAAPKQKPLNGVPKTNHSRIGTSVARPGAKAARTKLAVANAGSKQATALPTTKATTVTRKTAETPEMGTAKASPRAAERATVARNTMGQARTATTVSKSKPIAVAHSKGQSVKPASLDGNAVGSPKAMSFTKRTGLSSSLTAPTASSIGKGVTPRQSLCKQTQPLNNHTQLPVRTSLATSNSTQQITRQKSQRNQARAGVNGSPKSLPQSASYAIKRPNHLDEGFLARMMRPTQSSSSKAADKSSTPPRKIAMRSTTARNDHSTRTSLVGKDAKHGPPREPSPPLQDTPRSPSNNGDMAKTVPQLTDTNPFVEDVTPPHDSSGTIQALVEPGASVEATVVPELGTVAEQATDNASSIQSPERRGSTLSVAEQAFAAHGSHIGITRHEDTDLLTAPQGAIGTELCAQTDATEHASDSTPILEPETTCIETSTESPRDKDESTNPESESLANAKTDSPENDIDESTGIGSRVSEEVREVSPCDPPTKTSASEVAVVEADEAFFLDHATQGPSETKEDSQAPDHDDQIPSESVFDGSIIEPTHSS
ncbi:hypothetical protein DCS_07333 [Drechmeria coniospora]|uniref:Mucin-7 n=1 Tax=Drechmeria coniospora TaxID=98403 RepID=A0A151GE47_DRECN|nr:hypothetical protein DCS_07333 [Drechmeria coniospora]KYK55370.1 hypothetical protein DCS_07333 [Drechmeria coniospora]